MLTNINKSSLAAYVLLLLCVLTEAGFAAYALGTGKSLEPVAGVMKDLGFIIALLVGYLWGSSDGSKKKTELLNLPRP